MGQLGNPPPLNSKSKEYGVHPLHAPQILKQQHERKRVPPVHRQTSRSLPLQPGASAGSAIITIPGGSTMTPAYTLLRRPAHRKNDHK